VASPSSAASEASAKVLQSPYLVARILDALIQIPLQTLPEGEVPDQRAPTAPYHFWPAAQAALVSRQWREAFRLLAARREAALELRDRPKEQVNDSSLLSMAACFTQGLERLELRRCTGISTEGLGIALRHQVGKARVGETLQEVCLVGQSFVTDSNVDIVASLCPGLKVVELGTCRSDEKDSQDNFYRARFPVSEKLLITDESLRSLKKLQGLRRISMSFASKVSTRGWSELLQSCSTVEEIEVQMNTPLQQVNNSCLEAYFGSGAGSLMNLIMTNCPRVRKLDLPCMLFHDEILRELSRACPLLQELTLGRAWKNLSLQYFHRGVTEEGVCTFIAGCSSLKGLSIFSVRLLTSNRIFRCLARHAPDLERLCIDGQEESVVNIEALDLLAHGCPKLQHLQLPVMCTGTEWSSSYTSRGREQRMDLDADRVFPEVGLRYLTALHLSCNAWLQDKDMLTIGLCCPELAILKMKYCDLFSGHALGYIGKSCENLQELEICRSANFVYSDLDVQALSQGCHRLRRLRMPINSRDDVTDTSVESLCMGCPYLESLTLGGGTITSPVDEPDIGGSFTDSSLFHLAESCAELSHLTLLGCKDLGRHSSVSIAVLVDRCVRLRHLELIDCDHIDEKALEHLHGVFQRRPMLRGRLALWLDNPGVKLRYESRIVQQCEAHLASLNFCFQTFV